MQIQNSENRFNSKLNKVKERMNWKLGKNDTQQTQTQKNMKNKRHESPIYVNRQ